MAQRVTELLANPHKAGEMGRAGRQRVMAHYSVERMVTGYEDLLTELYQHKRKTPPATPLKSCAAKTPCTIDQSVDRMLCDR